MSQSNQIARIASFLLPVVIVLSGCAALQPVSVNTTIGGKRMTDYVIHLKEGVTARRIPSVTANLPAGIYSPQFEDSQKVYFATDKTLTGSNILGGRLFTGGGLTLTKTEPPVIGAYVIELEERRSMALEGIVPYDLVKK